VEETIVRLAEVVASAIDVVMIVVVAFGTIVTVVALILSLSRGERLPGHVREIWLRFAAWILLALEFALAADLIDTVVAPNWERIGQLGAIAGIRIALGYFLGRDISEYEEKRPQ
jgi:uncharacterized membrane protein